MNLMATGPEMPLPAYLSACGMDGRFAALAVMADGRAAWQCGIAARAHDIVADPARNLCAVMGRKPGREAYLCDLSTGGVTRKLAPLGGHSFDGHAVFSPDGAALFTTQSADGSQSGRIVVYDVAAGSVTRQFSSHGIEPHELIWVAPDFLAIGNGGILDRHSADAIESSLVLLDLRADQPARRWMLDDEWETLSIRHLARLPQSRIAFGMQDQDAATDLRPLVGIADLAGDIAFLDIPADLQRRLDGYIGSVAVDRSGGIVAASAPRGGAALFWSSTDCRYLGSVALSDVCGIAATEREGEFCLSSGHGMVHKVQLDPLAGVIGDGEIAGATQLGVQWDNHLSAVTVA
jgi:hypothetical protein